MSNRPDALTHKENIAQNWRALAALQPGAETAAVVKANAYGHGLEFAVPALAGAGCRTFFVAHVCEGLALREILGDGPDIYIFHGYALTEIRKAHEARLIPVLSTPDIVRAWRASHPATDAAAAIHIDTGMNRLGLKADEAADAYEHLGDLPISLVLSHLACADEPDHALNQQQYDAFTALSGLWPKARRSLANTAGTYLGPDYGFDMTRPGIGLYGGGPTPPPDTILKPGLTLEAPVLSIFEVSAGESTGYGATHTFETPRRLATVAFGYADGYPRSAANSGFAYYDYIRLPVVGRISMGLTTLDITELRSDIGPGSVVEFIGPNALLEEQAAAVGTIGYELVTGLGKRVERDHRN